ncbi:G-protein coupled receptor 182-like [Rhincodon typus]|uniref:G-protein coupled receptor 182-like n=1 Tax=Rhincodon typus TaxID=259920 RepID=UPI00202F1187|nr:G-protein coupled receptor 182-like [Rhincodon typus]XP_048474852.1 G-protein coupled receptor 182-like [Rhincodon typus]
MATPNDSLHVNNSDECYGYSCRCWISLDYKALDMSMFFFYLFILLVGLIENIIVIWINWRMEGSRKESNLYIFNMAIADMCAVLFIPLRMAETFYNYHWIWGDFLCKFDSFIYFVTLYSSIFFLTCFSVDRYISLRYPFQAQGSRDRQIRRMVCVCMWTVAVLLSIPQFVHSEIFEVVYIYCYLSHMLSLYVTSSLTLILGFIIPLPIIILSNIFTARAVKNSSNTESIKTSKIIYGYIIAFLLCWLPFYVIVFLSLLDTFLDCVVHQLVYFLYDMVECLSFSHCIINPILYNFIHKDFRDHLTASIVKYMPKRYVKEDDDISISSDTRHIVVIT